MSMAFITKFEKNLRKSGWKKPHDAVSRRQVYQSLAQAPGPYATRGAWLVAPARATCTLQAATCSPSYNPGGQPRRDHGSNVNFQSQADVLRALYNDERREGESTEPNSWGTLVHECTRQRQRVGGTFEPIKETAALGLRQLVKKLATMRTPRLWTALVVCCHKYIRDCLLSN